MNNRHLHDPYRVEADIVNILENGWARAVVVRDLTVKSQREYVSSGRPSSGDTIAVPQQIKVTKGARVLFNVVPHRSNRGGQKWFGIFCEGPSSPKRAVSKVPWSPWQDGEQSLILQLPSTKPGTRHDGIELACWMCGQIIVASGQIFCIRHASVWTKRISSYPHLRVDTHKGYNEVKNCDVQTVRCNRCENILGTYYEQPYKECEEGQQFPCFTIITAWEKKKWRGDKPSLATVLVGSKAKIEESMAKLAVSEKWDVERHFLEGGRLDEEAYKRKERAMAAMKAHILAEQQASNDEATTANVSEAALLKRAEEAESLAATKAAEAKVSAETTQEVTQFALKLAKRAKDAEERLKLIKNPSIQIVWECDVESVWREYPKRVGTILEACYSEKKKAGFSLNDQAYEVDFPAHPMFQRNTRTGVERQIRRREIAQQLDIVWECGLEDGDWIRYSSDVADSLEHNYRDRTKAKFKIAKHSYEIDFQLEQLAQVNVKTGMRRQVRRRHSISSQEIPESWTNNPNGQNCSFVPLSKESDEWRSISQNLTKSLPNAELHEVLRVQNVSLWEYFCFREDRARKLSKSGNANIVRVWHGTRKNDPKNICQDEADGFMMQRSRAGMWGQGIYFAANAKYSHKYAFTNSRSRCTLILARLVAGDEVALAPDSSLRQCPEKAGSTGRYDTVTGTTHGTKVYIIYENGRAYPEYLVTYTTAAIKSKRFP